ncbi:MAG: hypothetical protein DRJ56_05195 [Thermoprotei archaeon]|nr:MAG: hypothetical protein DRJ56_05195 [Thermoprotei archaeon]
MATWGSAFKTALKIVLMSIIWGIVGLVMMFIGIAIAGLPALMTLAGHAGIVGPGYPGIAPELAMGQVMVGVILVIIGYAITLLGTIATFLKYSAEYYASEMEERVRFRAPQPPPYPSHARS